MSAGSSRIDPTLDLETELARRLGGDAVVVGIDEVGRGALAGPVTVGACALRFTDGELITALPAGVRDSKALTPKRRGILAPLIAAAAQSTALGWTEASDIDEIGISAALTRSTLIALDRLCDEDGEALWPDAVIIDGAVDVLSAALGERGLPPVVVAVRPKADRDCQSVAAASVVAKVARDARMVSLHQEAPEYAWDRNKGYGAAVHREAIAVRGIHVQHRASWNLIGGGSAGVRWHSDGRPGDRAEQEGHR